MNTVFASIEHTAICPIYKKKEHLRVDGWWIAALKGSRWIKFRAVFRYLHTYLEKS